MWKILVLTLVASTSFAAEKKKDAISGFDSLGGNEALLEQAKELNPETSVSIVQKRAVSRTKRFEIAADYGMNAGGEPYLKTQNIGAQVNFHINPKWSVGARYYYHLNKLTDEADRLIFQEGLIPDTDHPKSTTLATLNYYPIYGKLNLFDKSVVQYDVYGLAGAGQVQLKSRSTTTWTAGAGIGFWLSQHLALRGEIRYQTYNIKPYTGERPLDLTMADFSLGYLL